MADSNQQETPSSRADRLLAAAERQWDVVVVGGGATGLGCAVDAASRGLSTLLLEARDYGSGTSSRSTKLIHGGVRYLRSFQFGLVREALQERERLYENAPGIVERLGLVVPVSNFFDRVYKSTGLRMYNLLAGRTGFGGSQHLGSDRLHEALPGLKRDAARQGLLFYDGQFDDARLVIALLETFEGLGGVAVNYAPVESISVEGGRVAGVEARDSESGEAFNVRARGVINATGVFSDRVRELADADTAPNLVFSRGTHIVLPKRFWPGDTGLVIPDTPDGRVLFILPWLDRVLIGTTEVPVESPAEDPLPTAGEIDYLLQLSADYLSEAPAQSDILSAFAGLRPLVARGGAGTGTASVSRSHLVQVSDAGLITVTGGKWTTYRRMAQDAVDRVAQVIGEDVSPSRTSNLPLRIHSALGRSGSGRLHPDLPYTLEDVRRAVWREQALTVEDVLCRRTRAALLDARAALDMIDAVAEVMAAELGRDAKWIQGQKSAASKSLANFLPSTHFAPSGS